MGNRLRTKVLKTVLHGFATVALVFGVSIPISTPASAEPAWDNRDLVDPWDSHAERLEDAPLGTPTLTRDGVFAMLRSLAVYKQIAAWGGWPEIAEGKELSEGVRDDRVVALRKRLLLTGDLPVSGGDPFHMDASVIDALRNFQTRHGLPVTSKVDEMTREALNIPVEDRINVIALNIERMRDLPTDPGTRHVMVNLPAAVLEAVDNGAVELRHRVVVGKEYRETPTMSSKITHIDFNPNWNVPIGLAKWDVIPRIRRDFDYLKREKFRIYSWGKDGREVDPKTVDWSRDDIHKSYRFVQSRGPKNSLGAVIIRFPNSDAIFLHDTPKKHLFGEDLRAHSSGCVRVDDIYQLVKWLLYDRRDVWTDQRIAQISKDQVWAQAHLKKRLPIHLMYVTSWVDHQGVLNFRPDIYGWDATKIAENGSRKVAANKAR